MNKISYIRKFISLSTFSIPKYDRIVDRIVLGEDSFISTMKAIAIALAEKVGKKLDKEIRDIGKQTNKVKKRNYKSEIKVINKSIDKIEKKLKSSESERSGKLKELDKISYLMHPRDELLKKDADEYMNDSKDEFENFETYSNYISKKISLFKTFKADFFREHKDTIKKTLGKNKKLFLKEWNKELKSISKITFLSKDMEIKKKQLYKLKLLQELTSEQQAEKLFKSIDTTKRVMITERNKVEKAIYKYNKDIREDKETKTLEDSINKDINTLEGKISEYQDEIKNKSIKIKGLLLEEKVIGRIPVYKNSDIDKLKAVKEALGDKKKKEKLYDLKTIYAPIMKTINDIAGTGDFSSYTSKLDMAKRIEADFIDWDMSDLDFVKLSRNPNNIVRSLLSYFKKRAKYQAMKERTRIIQEGNKEDIDTLDEDGRKMVDGLTYSDMQGVQEKIKSQSKANTQLDSLYWNDVLTTLKSPNVKKQIIKKSTAVFEKSSDEGKRIAPHNFYNGYIPLLKYEFSKTETETKTKHLGKGKRNIGGRKMTDSELNKIWDELFDKIFEHINEGLWEKNFRDSRIASSIVRFMGSNKKNNRSRRVAGVIWNNVLLKIVDVLEDKLKKELKIADDEEIKNRFNQLSRGGDVDALYNEIERKLKILKSVRRDAEHYASGNMLLANINASDNFTRDFLEPKEMIVVLRSKYVKMKKADSNRDDLEKRLNHLMDETTEEEAPIGEYSNKITYGPRRNTVTGKYNDIIDNIFMAFIKK